MAKNRITEPQAPAVRDPGVGDSYDRPPGSYVLQEDGSLLPNLKDEAMAARHKQREKTTVAEEPPSLGIEGDGLPAAEEGGF